MMNRMFFVAMLVLATPATARESKDIVLALAVNSGAVFEIGDEGKDVSRLEGVKLDFPTPFVRSVAQHFTGGTFDWAIGEKYALLKSGDTGVPSDPITPDEIHIAFRAIGDSDHRLLVISNGYDRALVFRASIRVNGKEQYTDVCTVLPKKHGFEHWPYASDRIVLTDIRLENWPEGKPPRCE